MGGSPNIAPGVRIRCPSPGLCRTPRDVVLASFNAGRGRRSVVGGYDVLGQEKCELRGRNHARGLQEGNYTAIHERAEETLRNDTPFATHPCAIFRDDRNTGEQRRKSECRSKRPVKAVEIRRAVEIGIVPELRPHETIDVLNVSDAHAVESEIARHDQRRMLETIFGREAFVANVVRCRRVKQHYLAIRLNDLNDEGNQNRVDRGGFGICPAGWVTPHKYPCIDGSVRTEGDVRGHRNSGPGRGLRQGIVYGPSGPRLDVRVRVYRWRNGFLREAQGCREQQCERGQPDEPALPATDRLLCHKKLLSVDRVGQARRSLPCLRLSGALFVGYRTRRKEPRSVRRAGSTRL